MSVQSDCCVIAEGKVYAGVFGGSRQVSIPGMPAGPLVATSNGQQLITNTDLGEVSKFTVTNEVEEKSKMSHRNKGGYACYAKLIKGAKLALTLDCTTAKNLALACNGKWSEALAGTNVVSELHMVTAPTVATTGAEIPGTFVPTQVLAASIASVSVAGGAALTLGTDYVLTEGGIILQPTAFAKYGGPLTDPLDIAGLLTPLGVGTSNLEISYTTRDTQHVEGLVTAQQELSIFLSGYNRVNGAPISAMFHRCVGGGTGALNFIADDFGTYELEFGLLPDNRISGGDDLSKYYWVNMG